MLNEISRLSWLKAYIVMWMYGQKHMVWVGYSARLVVISKYWNFFLNKEKDIIILHFSFNILTWKNTTTYLSVFSFTKISPFKIIIVIICTYVIYTYLFMNFRIISCVCSVFRRSLGIRTWPWGRSGAR